MSRRWRVDGRICHVYNRAAAKLPLFKTPADYQGFLTILARTKQESQPGIKLYGYCVMPNHWHLIICADTTPMLSHFMRHLTRRHAVAYLADHPERSGAVYQGRFKCVPVQGDHHLSIVLRYVDRNPLRAKFVTRAEQWLWSSTVGHAGIEDDPLLDPLPGGRLPDWLANLNEVDPAEALTRDALKRNVPVGDREWVAGLSDDWNEQRRKKGRPGKINRVEFQE
ncbi:MAG: transposase [Vicinamibacterales bacterium]